MSVNKRYVSLLLRLHIKTTSDTYYTEKERTIVSYYRLQKLTK